MRSKRCIVQPTHAHASTIVQLARLVDVHQFTTIAIINHVDAQNARFMHACVAEHILTLQFIESGSVARVARSLSGCYAGTRNGDANSLRPLRVHVRCERVGATRIH